MKDRRSLPEREDVEPKHEMVALPSELTSKRESENDRRRLMQTPARDSRISRDPDSSHRSINEFISKKYGQLIKSTFSDLNSCT